MAKYEGQRIKIADVSCGNSLWLLSAAKQLDYQRVLASFDGFDIDPNDLDEAHLENPYLSKYRHAMNIKKLDILASPLPEELIGGYDIVHVRDFANFIPNQDTTPLLSVVLSLLKPGGWLQWEETRLDINPVWPSPSCKGTACETIARIIRTEKESKGLKFDFLVQLDVHLMMSGFAEIHRRIATIPEEYYEAYTHVTLANWFKYGIRYYLLKTDLPQTPMTRESWLELFAQAELEMEQGVVLHHDKISVALGQKVG
ncbi:hypothetical protein M426DRAFT_7407 [Hypoxylon sp. CI-4A]|nr:hypothetical protein M426DRAFT_7407 [Hypoxylon sp. CI-4A]